MECRSCPNEYQKGQGAKGYCPTCYQRERRARAGTGSLRAGEARVASILSRPGARELRALCDGKLVRAFERLAKREGVSEADLVRRALGLFVVEP